MKRRDLFKMLGAMVAVPLVAPLVAMCKSKPTYDQTFYTDWRISATAAIKRGFESAKAEDFIKRVSSEAPTESVFMPTMATMRRAR